MPSTFGGLNTVFRGLNAQQVSLNTVGHNISNASTDGYTRQRVNLSNSVPETIYGSQGRMQMGTGVDMVSITRTRDVFADRQMWKEAPSLGYSQAMKDSLGQIEGVFQEPSDTGVQTVLNQFWSSWQTLSTNADDSGARTTVLGKGQTLVKAVQHAVTQLNELTDNINSTLGSEVKTINATSAEISSLNKQIATTESGGTDHANDLRDRRDCLVDQLSKMVNISVNEDQYGRYSVQTSGVNLVNAESYTKLDIAKAKDPDYGYEVDNVIVAGTDQVLNFSNGQLKGQIESRDSTTTGIKGYMNNLNDISKFLLQDFNAVHRAGYGMDNVNNRNFFGADSTTDYQTVTTMPTGGWFNALKVNPDLTASVASLAMIAAKTSTSGIAVDPSNPKGGTATVTTTGTYTGGTSITGVAVKVASVDSAGRITGITYSTDGGANWSSTVAGTGAFTLPIQGLNVDFKVAATGSNAIGDTYKFNLSATNVAVTASKPAGGVASVATTGTYTGGFNATKVTVKVNTVNNVLPATSGQITGISYSTDGGATWSANIPWTGSTALTIQGLNVNLNISASTANTAGDTFKFTLSAGNNASGDNAVLLGNRLKTDISANLGNASLDAYYSSVIGALGVQSQDAQRLTTNQQTVVDQITTIRENSGGVSTDEEMTHMIQFQKAYQAAARVLTSMDEMLDKLINSTGMVGR